MARFTAKSLLPELLAFKADEETRNRPNPTKMK